VYNFKVIITETIVSKLLIVETKAIISKLITETTTLELKSHCNKAAT